MTGKYQAEMRTERMWASYELAVAVREAADLDVLAAERLDDPHAGDALLQVRQVLPMRSRTSR